MRHYLLALCLLLLFTAATPIAAQTTGDSRCATELTQTYTGALRWIFRFEDASPDLLRVSREAAAFYEAVLPANLNCNFPLGWVKTRILDRLRGEYQPEELVRMLVYLDESLADLDSNSCAYTITNNFLTSVNWGDTQPLQIARVTTGIYRSIRDSIAAIKCDEDPYFKFIQTVLYNAGTLPPESNLVSGFRDSIDEALEGDYFTSSDCGYQLAQEFLLKVEWGRILASADLNRTVREALILAYRLGGHTDCYTDPAFSITQMVVDAAPGFPPDAALLKDIYDAAAEVLTASE